ncbi:MAG: molecular chaperone TorD family protein [Fervidicoccaceae archaeon]
MERSHLYLMFAAKLLGEPVEDDLIDLTGCDLSALKASFLRKDYDEVTRSFLSRAINEFYENYGYEAKWEPDHIATMLGFMAHLAKDYSKDSLKIQHRFLSVHVLPLLRYAEEVCPGLETLRIIIIEDLKVVERLLGVG